MVSAEFFPSRWRRLLQSLGVLWLVIAVLKLVDSDDFFDVLGAGAMAATGLMLIPHARRLGVTVSDQGLTVRSLFFGAQGSWTWTQLATVRLFRDRDLKSAADQLGVVTHDGETIRLGPAARQEPLRNLLCQRLPTAEAVPGGPVT